MPGATPTTVASALRPFIHNDFTRAVFVYDSLLGLFRQVGPVAGATHDVLLNIAGNTSVQVYTRNQAVPDAGYQQFLAVHASPKSFRGFDQLDGETRRQLGAQWNSMAWPNAVGGQNFERTGLISDLNSLVEQTYTINTAEYALAGIVDDSTTNYYDTSRGAYETIRSLVVAGGAAALTFDLLDQLLYGLFAQRGAKVQLVVMGEAQARRYNHLMRDKMTPQQMAAVSADPSMLPDYAPGVKVRLVRGLPSTLVLGLSGLDGNDSDWYFAIREAAPGGIDVLEYGPTQDAKVTQLSTSAFLICRNPWKNGRIENLATSW